ncbi:MAG TPA: c-type cytochrome [Burkholderiales bacterium]|nr:c-type cytochrome [Burkholderiales bacterium]
MKQGMMVIAAAAALGLAAHASAAVDEAKAKSLAQAKNCFTCHAVDKKLVGPAYKDVAKKYKGDKEAVAKLSKKVITGGSGVWGSIPMPPNPVKEDEAKLLVEWILSLH